MDKFGVPKKVNRHVIKAIHKLNYQGLENPNLSNIFDLVELSMKNNAPVRNLQSLVRQSLTNLFQLCVIEKQGTHYYKTRTFDNVETFPSIPSTHVNTRIFKKVVRNEERNTLNPNRKRGVLSEDSIPENDPKSSIKRLRTGKPLSRKGTKVLLPKVRTHHSNCQLLMEHDCCSSSSGGHKSEDEKENTTGVSSTESKTQLNSEKFEPALVEEKGFDKLYHNSDNLQKSVNDGYHHITESQTQDDQLNNCAEVLVNIELNKLDVFNENISKMDEGIERKNKLECVQSTNNDKQKENKSQLDGGAESKISSKCCQTKNNEEQKEQIVLITNQADITHIIKNNENTTAESVDQSIEIRNEFIANQDSEQKSNCDENLISTV